jgi:hypothetical protein
MSNTTRICLVMPVVFLMISCSTLRTGAPVKAGYDVLEEKSWLSRKMPVIDKLANLFPPPTEARKIWDNRQKKRHDVWAEESGGSGF